MNEDGTPTGFTPGLDDECGFPPEVMALMERQIQAAERNAAAQEAHNEQRAVDYRKHALDLAHSMAHARITRDVYDTTEEILERAERFHTYLMGHPSD
jgi:hypothetical protein